MSTIETIKVAIADDHKIFRDGIKVDNQFMTKNNVFRKLREQLKVWKRSWLLKN